MSKCSTMLEGIMFILMYIENHAICDFGFNVQKQEAAKKFGSFGSSC
jgi:hypothetical protein